MKTYLYKLSYNDGRAPCAPEPEAGCELLLTLALCKPAVRRTAVAGDRILGVTSQSLAQTKGYPLHAVIYAAVVAGSMDASEYYAERSPYRARPDCLYVFDEGDGSFAPRDGTTVRDSPVMFRRDLGQVGSYRNARILVSRDFRYFSPEPVPIPDRFREIHALIEPLHQGHRVNHPESRERELDALFRLLWKKTTRYTPSIVDSEAQGYFPVDDEARQAVPRGLKPRFISGDSRRG